MLLCYPLSPSVLIHLQDIFISQVTHHAFSRIASTASLRASLGSFIAPCADFSFGPAAEPKPNVAPSKRHTCRAKNQAKNRMGFGSVPPRNSPPGTLQQRRVRFRKKCRGLSTALERSNHSWVCTLNVNHNAFCHFILRLQTAHWSSPFGHYEQAT